MAYQFTLKKPRKSVYLVEANNRQEALHYFEEENLIINHKDESFKVNTASVKDTQKLAGTLMEIDTAIWEKYGWTSGSVVNQEIYDKELKKELHKKGIKDISYVQYHILEDANYHTLNYSLERNKIFKKDETYASTEKDFEEYTNKGGKTWDIQ